MTRSFIIAANAGMVLLLTAAAALANTPDGADIFAHGADADVLPCAACHGANGQGNTSIGAPKLAGLPAPVVKAALAQIAESGGGNAAMLMVARALSPAQTDALAAYLASLK